MGHEEEEKKQRDRAQVKTSELRDQNEFIKEENENVKVSQGKPATKADSHYIFIFRASICQKWQKVIKTNERC